MTDTYTVSQLRTDENLLRRVAGEVLNPGPWEHRIDGQGKCAKCVAPIEDIRGEVSFGYTREFFLTCPVPNPATGSLPDIAEALLRLTNLHKIVRAMLTMRRVPTDNLDAVKVGLAEEAFILATPIDRILCCLVALGKARVEP